MSSRISVVINTLNEERNLPYALRSVQPWADEIVVVDMYSTDRTVEIAKQFGAKVFLHKGPGFNYAPREYAVGQASGSWILVLDADELIPASLSKILRHIADEDNADVVLVPRLNYLFGVALRHTRWGPDQDLQARFFKKDKISASSIAHQDFQAAEGAKVLRITFDGSNALVHFNYLDLTQFIERLNRYTSIEASQALERRSRSTVFRAITGATREFLSRYIKSKGFLDGWRGFYLSSFMSFYRLTTAAKLKELMVVGTRDGVVEVYRKEAESVLSEYVSATNSKPSVGAEVFSN
jgi:glycosyltransferase involved in cell wall biosynthesis